MLYITKDQREDTIRAITNGRDVAVQALEDYKALTYAQPHRIDAMSTDIREMSNVIDMLQARPLISEKGTPPLPVDFGTWTYNNLVKFAHAAHDTMFKQNEANAAQMHALVEIKSALVLLAAITSHHTPGELNIKGNT